MHGVGVGFRHEGSVCGTGHVEAGAGDGVEIEDGGGLEVSGGGVEVRGAEVCGGVVVSTEGRGDALAGCTQMQGVKGQGDATSEGGSRGQ